MRVNVGILVEDSQSVLYHIIDTDRAQWVIHPTNFISRYGKTYGKVLTALDGRTIRLKVHQMPYEHVQQRYYGWLFKDGFWHAIEPDRERKFIILDEDDIAEFLDSMDYEHVTAVTDLRPNDILVRFKLIAQIESCELSNDSGLNSKVNYKAFVTYLTNEGGLLIPNQRDTAPAKFVFSLEDGPASVVWFVHETKYHVGFRVYRQNH